jgi:hypothetical protein
VLGTLLPLPLRVRLRIIRNLPPRRRGRQDARKPPVRLEIDRQLAEGVARDDDAFGLERRGLVERCGGLGSGSGVSVNAISPPTRLHICLNVYVAAQPAPCRFSLELGATSQRHATERRRGEGGKQETPLTSARSPPWHLPPSATGHCHDGTAAAPHHPPPHAPGSSRPDSGDASGTRRPGGGAGLDGWRQRYGVHKGWDKGGRELTRPHQPRNVPVACDLAGRDLLDGRVDGVEEGLGFVRAGHFFCLPSAA